MKYIGNLILFFFLISDPLLAQTDSLEQVNMQIATQFYEDLWFNNRTENYLKYVADNYIIHDIMGDDGLEEKAIVQKEIADFFWQNGEMSGKIDYQLATGNRVATRWYWTYKPSSLLGSFLVGDKTIPIINVFRFENGKIVEVWNHRHDIDMNRTNIFVIKGLLIGLVIALVPFIFMIRYKRKLKRLKKTVSQ